MMSALEYKRPSSHSGQAEIDKPPHPRFEAVILSPSIDQRFVDL
jgi:hypothetical protein